MNTFLNSTKTEEGQKIAAFSGEGAYHGSSKTRDAAANETSLLSRDEEHIPTTLISYLERKEPKFSEFKATFPNLCEIKALLPVPTQEQIKNDSVTFCWAPFEQAKQEAGPVTKNVLLEMEKHLEGKKKFVYIDSKIQYFQTNDLPVDSKLWHVDGSITVRNKSVQELGYTLLHDMKARMISSITPPKYLAYQSSSHCATQFAIEPVSVMLPDCIPNFDVLDDLIQKVNPAYQHQSAGSIISFDGFSLHRAVPATASGWRLWIRCVETDREIKIDSSIIDCYGTVYRTT